MNNQIEKDAKKYLTETVRQLLKGNRVIANATRNKIERLARAAALIAQNHGTVNAGRWAAKIREYATSARKAMNVPIIKKGRFTVMG